MQYTNYDHTFLEIGRLGSELPDRLIGGDDSTWGTGSKSISVIHKLEPTLGAEGPGLLIINGAVLDLEDYDVDEEKLLTFVSKNIDAELTSAEVDFVLYLITSTYFGEKEGEISSFDIDEWPTADLVKCIGSDLSGKLVLNMNTRYNCSTEISDNGEVNWMDTVDPDDDAKRLAVMK